ncbi:serine dehydratase beta chain [Natribacillus halophilus]|uniref:L-serine ammonia-lyase n=1 Tax=Natribacillus halophilus TaxID=549003 RepID=A0A1G8MZK6_9BACI|nr:serine dehydratase beta chain [Natribacillus halophilus]SDI73323.1 L-serine dehydratase, iron-sulfur-dependent, beta subunit [Natribacillus halophilus]
MEFQSCFDIIGPIMVGPSSSHTAGAVSIGTFTHELLGGWQPEKVRITLYDSFAQTYQGHGTDKAFIGGLLGMKTNDTGIKDALTMAEENEIDYRFSLEQGACPYYDHPNTSIIVAKNGRRDVKVGGASLGGGLAKIFLINDVETSIRLSTDDDLRSICNRLPMYMFTHKEREA